MKHLLIKTLAGSGLLLMGLTASAQYLPRQDYQGQTQFDQRQAQAPVFDHLRTDLDRVHANTMPFTPARDRVVRAQERVNECQRDIRNGTYDARTFDHTIASVQNVIDSNNLTYTNQQFLRHDIRALSRLETRLVG